jgi:hypothetical protein
MAYHGLQDGGLRLVGVGSYKYTVMSAHQDPLGKVLEGFSFIGVVCRDWEVVVEALLTAYCTWVAS